MVMLNISASKNHVGESVRDIVLKRCQYEDPNKQSEPAKHLKYFPDHQFEWEVLTIVLEYKGKRKILETILINL